MKITYTIKFILFILTFATIIWLGGSIFRAVVAYSIFVPATQLELKQDQTDEIRMHTVRIYTDTAIYTTVSFAVVFVIAIFFLFKYRRQLKVHGWLFMSFVLFFLASPVEIYLIYLDIKLMLYVNYNQNLYFKSYEVTEYFINRLRNLSVISTLAYLSFFTSIIFIIFKPLDRSIDITTENKE